MNIKIKKITSLVLLLMMLFTLNISVSAVDKKSFDGKIDIGGYSLYVRQIGKGSPTVLFEHGGGADHTWFNATQDAVYGTTNTFSYDRAGDGQSDASPLASTTLNQVHELHTLLEEANVSGPYIIVAHSLGGFNARVFAAEYPDEVAGIIFVDCSHEGQLEAICNLVPDEWKELLKQELLSAMTFEEWNISQQQVIDARTKDALRNIPITVLSANNHMLGDEVETLWASYQADLASLSNDSVHITLNAKHIIPLENPDAITSAINDLIQRVKNKK